MKNYNQRQAKERTKANRGVIRSYRLKTVLIALSELSSYILYIRYCCILLLIAVVVVERL